MGFASVVGQVFLVIIFMLLFVQLYNVQQSQNKLQTELYSYQKKQLEKQTASQLQIVQVYYNTTWNTTNLEIRNTGSTSFQINNSDLYINGIKFLRNYTSRKFFACYEYSGYRCGEIRFGDNVNNEQASLLLLYHFNNDTQWSQSGGTLTEDYANVAANELTPNNIYLNASGKFDRAYYFNGTNAYANRTNTAQNAFTNTTSYTWSFWIYPTANGNNTRTIISKDAAATGYRIYINASGNLIVQSPNANQIYNCTTAVPLNQWSHVGIVYVGIAAGQTMRFYLNGTSINNQTVNAAFRSDAASQFNLGRNASSLNDYYAGMIDEFAFYNVAKTDSDIQALYRKGVYSGGLYNFDPKEILEIDAYQTLPSGTYTVTYATQEGATVSTTMVV